MALPLLTPALTRTRQAVVERGSKAVLRLVPKLEAGESASNRSLFIVSTAVGIIVLGIFFILNTLSTNDAFQLNALQTKNAQLVAQRDEINRKISDLSSPENLSTQAKALGMKPAVPLTPPMEEAGQSPATNYALRMPSSMPATSRTLQVSPGFQLV